MLVNSKELFEKAYAGKYAIGAFNVNNLEIVQGIMEAAQEAKSPVILQVSKNARKYADPIYLKALIDASVLKYPEVPLVCHLDHGEDVQVCVECMEAGFTSVMIDGSHLPFEENVALTKEVVELAKKRGVSVEAELGKLAGVEDEVQSAEGSYTDVDEAVQFVERTGVDSLAVAVGTSHGAFKFLGEPRLDFERLNEITKRLVGFPLVLHGASSVLAEEVARCNEFGGEIVGARGVPEEMLRRAASETGVCKINIDTDVRLAFTASVREVFIKQPGEFDPRKYLGPAREAVKGMVLRKIERVLGCGGKI